MAEPFHRQSAEEVTARLARDLDDAQDRAMRASIVRGEIDAIRERVSSPRKELWVSVDASGRLIDVHLSDAALRLGAGALGRLLVDTTMKAQHSAGARAAQIAADAFGEDDPAVAHLRGEIAARAGDATEITYRS